MMYLLSENGRPIDQKKSLTAGFAYAAGKQRQATDDDYSATPNISNKNV
jgi:hypothetical protein